MLQRESLFVYAFHLFAAHMFQAWLLEAVLTA